jgi:glucokinase
LINDFQAVGFGLTALKPSEYVVLHEGHRKEKAPIACLGAGTGLGEVYLTHNGSEYDVWSTEGGHTDYAAKNDLEYGFLKYMINVEKKHRVSVERMVCGTGIPFVYRYLRSTGIPEDPQIKSQLEEKDADQAKIISKNGLSVSCFQTLIAH